MLFGDSETWNSGTSKIFPVYKGNKWLLLKASQSSFVLFESYGPTLSTKKIEQHFTDKLSEVKSRLAKQGEIIF